MKYSIITALSFFTLSVTAQKEIKIEDASDYSGDSIKIYSKIYGGKYLKNEKGSLTFLDVGGSHPNELLTIVIGDNVRKLFKNPPEEYFKGGQVCVTGRIQMNNGKPEIIVSNEKQIEEVIFDKLPDNEPM